MFYINTKESAKNVQAISKLKSKGVKVIKKGIKRLIALSMTAMICLGWNIAYANDNKSTNIHVFFEDDDKNTIKDISNINSVVLTIDGKQMSLSKKDDGDKFTGKDNGEYVSDKITQMVVEAKIGDLNRTFTYSIPSKDVRFGVEGIGSGTINIYIKMPQLNNAPVAVDDRFTLDLGKVDSIKITASELLENDTDADGDELKIESVSSPANGDLVDNKDGSYTYIPNPDFTGDKDSFTYTITDEVGKSTATVTIEIIQKEKANNPPVAVDDSFTLDLGKVGSIKITASELLENDTDADGDKLKIGSVSSPVNGNLIDNQDGTYTYVPNQDFTGDKDSFTYTITDEVGKSTATVTIEIIQKEKANNSPIAVDDSFTLDLDKVDSIKITASELLENDTDADGDKLKIESVSSPANGNLIDNKDGTYTYVPNQDFTGDKDSFTYIVTDEVGKDTGTVTITIIPKGKQNNSPIAVDDSFTLDLDKVDSIKITASELLENDTDADGDKLKIESVSSPANGNLIDNKDGTYAYVPNQDFTGDKDSFTYIVTDEVGKDTGTVTITIIPKGKQNNSPIAIDDSFTLDLDKVDSIKITALELLENDTDADGDKLEIESASSPANGNLIDNKDGSYTYVPNSDFTGDKDSFTYTITDKVGNSTATVTIEIIQKEKANNPPVAVDDMFTLDLGKVDSIKITALELLENDTDADGDKLEIESVSSPANGNLIDNKDGSYTYVPNSDFTGDKDSFTYTITDKVGKSTAKVAINIVKKKNDENNNPNPDPKPNPDPTPNPDPKPNPDPTPNPDSQPKPDDHETVEVINEPIPSGNANESTVPVVADNNDNETEKQIDVPEEEIPVGPSNGLPTNLPNTGEIPPELFYMGGVLLIVAGIKFRRK